MAAVESCLTAAACHAAGSFRFVAAAAQQAAAKSAAGTPAINSKPSSDDPPHAAAAGAAGWDDGDKSCCCVLMTSVLASELVGLPPRRMSAGRARARSAADTDPTLDSIC